MTNPIQLVAIREEPGRHTRKKLLFRLIVWISIASSMLFMAMQQPIESGLWLWALSSVSIFMIVYYFKLFRRQNSGTHVRWQFSEVQHRAPGRSIELLAASIGESPLRLAGWQHKPLTDIPPDDYHLLLTAARHAPGVGLLVLARTRDLPSKPILLEASNVSELVALTKAEQEQSRSPVVSIEMDFKILRR